MNRTIISRIFSVLMIIVFFASFVPAQNSDEGIDVKEIWGKWTSANGTVEFTPAFGPMESVGTLRVPLNELLRVSLKGTHGDWECTYDQSKAILNCTKFPQASELVS